MSLAFRIINRFLCVEFPIINKPGKMPLYPTTIRYSETYYVEDYEYRHVILPKKILSMLPVDKLLEDYEWKKIGVEMPSSFEHYAIHKPEPHVLLFRRKIR